MEKMGGGGAVIGEYNDYAMLPVLSFMSQSSLEYNRSFYNGSSFSFFSDLLV